MRNLRLALGLSLIAVSLVATTSAFAGKSKDTSSSTAKEDDLPKIQMTGISEFDSVFSKAKAIQDSLDTAHTELSTAQGHLATELGLANTTTVMDSLKDLESKASHKVSVAMKGSTPSLKATDAVTPDAQKGIDAANALFETSEKTATTAKGLLPQSQELVGACIDFPGKVPGLVNDPLAAAKALKVVGSNLQAIKGTPDQITRLTGDIEKMWSDVKAAFPM